MPTTQVITNYKIPRLTPLFRKGINYSNYKELVSNTQYPIVGNLPKDLLNIIISANIDNKQNSIKHVQQAYILACNILSQRTTLIKERASEIKITSDNIISTMLALENNKAHSNNNFELKFSQLLKKAEKFLKDGIKKIIPDLEDVKLNIVADGTYSSIYKMEFIGKNGNKIISDKALKCFHDKADPWFEIDKKCAEFLENSSTDYILQNHNYPNIEPNMFETMKNNIINYVKIMTNIGKEISNFSEKIHGAFAEANIAEYIRFMSGHKITFKDGIVLPDMYVLSEKPFAIAEFIDKSMTPDKTFDFSRLGLFHSDLNSNDNNTINGICVDIGGISPILNIDLLKQLINQSPSIQNRYASIEQARKSSIVGDKKATAFLKEYKKNKPLKHIKYKGLFQKHKDNIINEIINKKIGDDNPHN